MSKNSHFTDNFSIRMTNDNMDYVNEISKAYGMSRSTAINYIVTGARHRKDDEIIKSNDN